jgi:Protein of unknown function (DUF3631)
VTEEAFGVWETDPAGVDKVDPADGAALLDEVEAIGRRYIAFTAEHDRIAWVLFHAATHAQSAWEHATRLVYTSPQRRCGKTRAQDIGAELGWNSQSTVNISVAALVRSIDESDPPTLHLDEYDTVFGGRKPTDSAEDLRGIINAGFARGKPYRRWNIQTREQEVCPSFCMVTLAGIGDLPDTIEDRAVILRMRRRAKTEIIQPYRIRRDRPALVKLNGRLHAWVHANLEKLRTTEPVMPVEDRDADKWEPLLAIADIAGGRWPERARVACTALCVEPEADDATLGERLVCELAEIFRRVLTDYRRQWPSVSGLPSSVLVDELCALEEAPWGDLRGDRLTPRILARLLRPYGIKSKGIRVGDAILRGYEVTAFHEAWIRYCGIEDTRPKAQDGNVGF